MTFSHCQNLIPMSQPDRYPKFAGDPDDIEAVRSALDQSDLGFIGVNQTRRFRAGFQNASGP